MAMDRALLLLLAASLIALTVYGVVYERETKILVSEAKVEAQLQAAVLKSELEKQRSVPVILAMDTDLVESVRNPSLQHSLAISKKLETLRTRPVARSFMSSTNTGRTLSASNYAGPGVLLLKLNSMNRGIVGNVSTETFVTNSADQILLTSIPGNASRNCHSLTREYCALLPASIPGWTLTMYSSLNDALRSARAAASSQSWLKCF